MRPETKARIANYIRAHRADGGSAFAKKDKAPEVIGGDKDIVKKAEKGGGKVMGEDAPGHACRRKRGAGGRFTA